VPRGQRDGSLRPNRCNIPGFPTGNEGAVPADVKKSPRHEEDKSRDFAIAEAVLYLRLLGTGFQQLRPGCCTLHPGLLQLASSDLGSTPPPRRNCVGTSSCDLHRATIQIDNRDELIVMN
jgi:hypothetical protein